MTRFWPFSLFLALLFFSLSACKITQQQATIELRRSVLNNDPSKVQRFCKKGALVNYKESKRGWSPLLYASEGGYTEVAETLLEYGADPNQQSEKDKVFPLQRAASNGHFEIVQMLLKQGADVNMQDSKHRATALMYASLNGHIEVVELLTENNAFLDVRGNRGESALFLAVSSQHHDIVAHLLEKGANKVRPTIYGTTCLQKAEELKDAELIKMLND